MATSPHADVAELVDALASGASVRKYVKVQVLSSAPRCSSTNPQQARLWLEPSQTTSDAHPHGWAFFVVLKTLGWVSGSGRHPQCWRAGAPPAVIRGWPGGRRGSGGWQRRWCAARGPGLVLWGQLRARLRCAEWLAGS